MSTNGSLPDLLRRFVATPYRFEKVSGSTVVSFETNDQELLTAFKARSQQLADALASSSGKSWSWKVVRDYDIFQEGEEAFLLSGETLSTVFLGSSTVAAIDWSRSELLGFVAANVSAHNLLATLIDAGQQHHLL